VISHVVRSLVVPCLALALAGSRPVVIAAQDPAAPLVALPANIRFDPVLQSTALMLLRKSKTFERQCARIAVERHVRLVVVATPPPRELSAPRARSVITRHVYGAIRAVVEIPITGASLPELIGHEFEHVIEQIEGIDLAARARNGASDVLEVLDGVFETTRARSAGLMVAMEADAETDAAAAATPRPRHATPHPVRPATTRPAPPTSLLRR
jgi:hypothetical protein